MADRNGNCNLTKTSDRHHRPAVTRDAEWPQEAFMPILMVALIALAAFGFIGIFLGAAVVLEQRTGITKDQPNKKA